MSTEFYIKNSVLQAQISAWIIPSQPVTMPLRQKISPLHSVGYKKRRLQGACDICKQKKSEYGVIHNIPCDVLISLVATRVVRCEFYRKDMTGEIMIFECHIGDSSEMPLGSRCSNCLAFDSECTHFSTNVCYNLIVFNSHWNLSISRNERHF